MKWTQNRAPLFLLACATAIIGCSATDEPGDENEQTNGDGDGNVIVAPGDGDGDGSVPASGGSDPVGTGGDASTSTGGSQTASTGGNDSAGSGGETADDPCTPFADFEVGEDGFGVYANENASAGSLTTPAGGVLEGAASNTTGDGADGSSGALVYAGSGYAPAAAEGGPGGIRFAVDPIEACQDVSSYTGISFWAKGTVDATDEWGGIDANTVILFAVPDALDEGATQVDYRFTLNASWTLHEVPFTDFGTDGYSATAVQRLKFMLPGGAFDVAIDNVGFY